MAGKKKLAGAGIGVGARVAPKASKYAGKAAMKAGKAQAKLAKQALSTKEPAGPRYLKYGLFALAGFAIGALLGRSGSGDDSSGPGSTGHHSPDPGSPAGRRGETWGSGTPTGPAGGGAPGRPGPGAGPPPPPPGGPRPAGPPHQRSEEPNRTGAERDYSDPSSGPLIGEQRRESVGGVTEQQEEVENRIRTRIGDDARTKELPRLNIEVNDGVAEIRGVAPSIEIKDAVGEIAADTNGVREVRNLIAVS